MKRLLVVAESSLIVEAIAIGLRKSGEFKLLGQVDGSRASVEAILAAEPDVVLVDEMELRERMLELIRALTAAAESMTVIVLTLATDAEWLDEIFAAGATSAVSKATQPAALATLIRETINGHAVHLHKPLGAAPAASAPRRWAAVATGARSAPAGRGGIDERRDCPQAMGHRADREVPSL